MKKGQITKIIALVVAVASLIGAAIAISASAEETKPQIIAQNVAYEGDFALMYAVDASTATAPVSLYLYTEAPTKDSVAHKKYVVENVTAASGNLKKDSYIFKTEGVAAKDMADVFYVQAVDANGNKSDVVRYSVGEYLYERLATVGITEKQEFLYRQTLTFGAAAQAVLAPDTPPVTEFRYVKVIGGLLPDGFNSGIFPIDTEISPVGNGVNSWRVQSFADDKTVTETKIAAGKSFKLEGVTFVIASEEVLLPEGVVGFENSTAVPSGISGGLHSSGAALTVVPVEKDGTTTNALKFTSTNHTATDHLAIATTPVIEDGFNTVVFDMDVNFGTSGNYELIVRDKEGTMIFNFAIGINGNYFKLADNTTSGSGRKYNFWSVNEFAPVNDWINLRIELTPDAVTKNIILNIYYDGFKVNTGVDGNRYYTKDDIFVTAEDITRIDFRASSATENSMYVDNVLTKKTVKKVNHVGTLDYEKETASTTTNGVAVDTVYGETSNVYKFAPSGQVVKNFYPNSVVASDKGDAIVFDADVKISNGTASSNAAFDFMWDAGSAVFWLRFDISSGKFRLFNNSGSSEAKLTLGNANEYVHLTVIFTTNRIDVQVNGEALGSFTITHSGASATASQITNIRIRSMSSHTDQAIYFDNVFFGSVYAN